MRTFALIRAAGIGAYSSCLKREQQVQIASPASKPTPSAQPKPGFGQLWPSTCTQPTTGKSGEQPLGPTQKSREAMPPGV